MPCPFKNFNESQYLNQNSDVRDAVEKGEISSGWEHFICYGFRENRPGVSDELVKLIQDIFKSNVLESIPPKDLRKRVHGDEDPTSFDRIGKIVSFNICEAVDAIIKLDENSRILDFGCGCGRVIRYFHRLCGPCSFVGADIDEEAIEWCRYHLSAIGRFVKNDNWPPLPFEEEFFDFIYSISVFTHLPEDMQFVWLNELRRVIKKGGHILLTTTGEDFFKIEDRTAKEHFQNKGFYFSVGEGTKGLPNFYQTSFHSHEYIYKYWSKFFEIKQIIKKGIANHQDLIICEKLT